MIVIKHVVDGKEEIFQSYDVGNRNLNLAIYHLKELRISIDGCMNPKLDYKSWIEINGLHIPDGQLMIADRQDRRKSLLAFVRESQGACPSCGHKSD